MVAYSGRSKRIKNALKQVVSAIQYDAGSGAENLYQEVTDTTADQFDGYPVLQILPGDYTTEKAAFNQNDRSVNLVLRTHLRIETQTAATYDKMYDMTDLLLDALDQADDDNSLNTIDATLGTWILNAIRGDWSVVDSAQGSILLCDVNVEVKYSKDL